MADNPDADAIFIIDPTSDAHEVSATVFSPFFIYSDTPQF